MKYFIKTFGCQMNFSDSERIAGKLEEIGYKSASNDKEADLIILNTCSVRQSAEDRVWGAVNNYKKKKLYPRNSKIIVTGCIAKRKKVVEKMDKVDIFLDIKDLNKLPKLLNQNGIQAKNTNDYFQIKPKYQNSFTAYVPIMTGCDNFCSYCIVPFTRGRETSRPMEEILEEVKGLVKQGYKEIWLLGQNVNSYINHERIKSELKTNKGSDFVILLEEINKLPGKFWIRFVSSHPKDMGDNLIKVISHNGHITPYVHLALQSGDNETLRKMNRHYTCEDYLKLVKKIRKAIPDVFLATDIIVGFPGETQKQFLNTVKIFKQARFSMVYINKYSPREGTASFKMKDNVSMAEKDRRAKELNRALSKIALDNNKKLVGRQLEVLIDGRAKDGLYIGKDKSYRSVKIKSEKDLIGQFIRVKIKKAFDYGLEGEIVILDL
jgi:tRNA-2-methylthio-N6-dimethylallyladenosine synthase